MTTTAAKAVPEILTDRSVVWNVEYHEGHLHVVIGCVDQNAAELLAECLNDATYVNADVGETVGR